MLSTLHKPVDLDNLVHRYQVFELIKLKEKEGKSRRSICRDLIDEYKLTINAKALCERFRVYLKNQCKFDARQKFSSSTEIALIGMVRGFTLASMPIPRIDIIEHIRHTYLDGQEWDGDGWLSNFLDRYRHELHIENVSSISSDRVHKVSYDECVSFINNYENYLFSDNINENCIFNIDEVRLSINSKNLKFKALVSKKLITPYFKESPGGLAATYVPIISKDAIIIHFIVFPEAYNPSTSDEPIKSIHYTRTCKPPLYRLRTTSGYLNHNCWMQILNIFINYFRNIDKKSKCLLIMDNLSIHVSVDSLSLLNRNNIVPLRLPCYSTSWSQPLDNLVFAQLKQHYKRQFIKSIRSSSPIRNLNLEVARKLHDIHTIITKSTIKRSWDNVGLIPFNKGKFLARAAEACQEIEVAADCSIVQELAINTLNLINEAQAFESDQPSKRTKVDKEKTSKRSSCFCQFHKQIEEETADNDQEKEFCDSCNVFFLCNNCYQEFPEVWIGHVEYCKDISKKLRKKKT